MFTTSIGHDAQELTNFGITNVGMLGFGYRPEVRRYMVGRGVVSGKARGAL